MRAGLAVPGPVPSRLEDHGPAFIGRGVWATSGPLHRPPASRGCPHPSRSRTRFLGTVGRAVGQPGGPGPGRSGWGRAFRRKAKLGQGLGVGPRGRRGSGRGPASVRLGRRRALEGTLLPGRRVQKMPAVGRNGFGETRGEFWPTSGCARVANRPASRGAVGVLCPSPGRGPLTTRLTLFN